MGGGGGGGQQTQFNNSTSTSGPNPMISNELNQVKGDFWNWYQGNKSAPNLYPGQMHAPQSDYSTAAMNALAARGRAGNPAVKAGQQAALATLGGRFLDMGNPYLQNALDLQYGRQNDKFLKEVAPVLDSKFAAAGRDFGGAHAEMTQRLARDAIGAQAGATAQAITGEYGNERNRMMTAMGLVPQLADQDYRDIAAQAEAGQMHEGWMQKAIDEQVGRWDYAQTGQADWYTRVAQMLQTMVPGGQTRSSGTSTGTGAGGGGDGAQLASAGIGLVGALGSAAIIA